MAFPLPDAQPLIVTQPVMKTPVSCCTYTCWMGTPFTWTCPGCGSQWTIEGRVKAPDPPADAAG